MADTFKQLTDDDVTFTRQLVHESVPVTGTIISGTYTGSFKNYTHEMFESVYDYAYLSSSANHIFDISVGYSANSNFSSSANVQNDKKIQMYNIMASTMMGYDITGSVIEFDQDGNINAGGTKLRECLFLSFDRVFYKDEIKKGTFSITLLTSSLWDTASGTYTITDAHATSTYFVNAEAGEYSYLTCSSPTLADNGPDGLIFYQAGVIVLTSSIFTQGTEPVFYKDDTNPATYTVEAALSGASATASFEGLRNRISNISFVNTTELHSALYFCRLGHSEFNYSSNPTYLSSSQIRVKNNPDDEPVTFVTSIGLYSPDNELLAVGKVSEPLQKTPSNEILLRARIDY